MRRTICMWIVLGAIGCATRVDVTTTAAPDVDFSRYDTYALVPPPEARDAIRERLEVEIADEIEERGYRAASLEDADLLVVFRGSGHRSERTIWAESPGGCCQIQNYIAGTLRIDIFDARGSQRVWSGVGRVDLSIKTTEKELEEAASDAAEAVLAKFPGHVGHDQ